MIDLNNYTTKDFQVECRTGVIASSVTGKIVPVNKYGVPVDVEDPKYKHLKKKIHQVNKATIRPYYTRTYNAGPGFIEMHVIKADWLNKKGLNWHVIYSAMIEFEDYQFYENGENTLEYWLGRCLDDTRLIPKTGYEEPVGMELGQIVGIKDFLVFYNENTKIKDIFKKYEAGEFYGKTGFLDVSLKKLPFGVEVEFTGMERRIAAEYLASFFGTSVTRPTFTYYDRYTVKDSKGRSWHIKSDGSIKNPVDYYKRPANDNYKCELESPVLTYQDIDTLQELIRGLRKDRYMVVNESCGIHVHVGGKYTPVAMKNIYNIIASHQKLLKRALNISSYRITGYCSYVTGSAYKDCDNKSLNMKIVEDKWDNVENSRYKFINFSSFFNGKGVEFRCFNSTVHAGKLKSYIQLSLAICNYAMNTDINVRPDEKDMGHDRTKMRNFLSKLGLTGSEFKTCRYHLTKNLKDKKNKDNHIAA